MKWWYWLILELLIIFGVIAWIYFFPSEIEGDFAKGMIGFVLIYAIENCKDINRRKTMSENYTIEQNAGENRIEGGVVSLSVAPKELNKHCKWCKGAEFGYNKGNEWHYVKDELPPEDVPLLCMRGGNIYVAWFILGKWKGDKYNDVKKPYAWKEIVLPKEIE